METINVIDVYGDKHVVCRKSYESGRNQVSLCTKNGKMKLYEYYERMGRTIQGRCVSIHRDNIASVVSP